MAQPSIPAGSGEQGPASAIDWAAVLAQHDRWLRTIVFARLGEPQAVDDVMQEVSLAAVRQHSPLQDPSKVAPWLYRLAVTQSLLYRRKQGRRRRLVGAYAQRTRPEQEERGGKEPLHWLLADERRQLVRRALDRLPKRDREILLLKYGEDWSYREMVQHLGISQTALQARLHRARQRLREQLAELDSAERES